MPEVAAEPSIKPPPPALGGSVLRGSLWMMLNTAVTRGASLVAQIILGWLLSKQDFGLYALAISASSLAGVLKDGGVRQLLVQRQRDYDVLVGPVFWMAVAFNAATGVVLALLAWPLAWIYSEPRLVPMMLIIAAAQPISTPGAIFTTRLQVDLRFREAGMILTAAALVRYIGAVLFALAGFEALSFVLPLPIIALVEWGMGWWYTRERLWRRSASPGLWLRLFAQTKWVLVGTFGIAAVNLGANIVIGLFVALSIVGAYFFAFQIVIQIGQVLSANLASILSPAFAKIADDPRRKRAAAAKALRQTMLVAGPLCLGLAATFAPIELAVWHGRWADAAEAVNIMALFYPASIVASVALSILHARGEFRAWGLALIAIAAATLGPAAVGAKMHGTATAIALYTSIGTMAASCAVTFYGFRQIGITALEVLRTGAPAWLLSIAAAAVAMILDLYAHANGHPIVRFLVSGVVFCLVFGAAVRMFIPEHLCESLALAPSRVQRLIGTVFRLRSEPSRHGTTRDTCEGSGT